MAKLLPISAIVPTRNRDISLETMLKSLSEQSAQPLEMIVVDASTNHKSKQICQAHHKNLNTKIIYHGAIEIGAATQRNQAISIATQHYILFLDDDIIFEPECIHRLWLAINSQRNFGGINAMITNQNYGSPGIVSRTLFRILHGKSEVSYAGKCIGPACNLLPDDRPNLAEVVPVEWLNTTCTLYNRKALSNPVFPSIFQGASLMEDLTLSLTVGKKWKLANARTARIFHDSQSGDHKKSPRVLAKMELINRHYVMTKVLNRNSFTDYIKLFIFQSFGLLSSATSLQGVKNFLPISCGKLQGIAELAKR